MPKGVYAHNGKFKQTIKIIIKLYVIKKLVTPRD